jgi:spoIIIJ-associated protein
MSKKSNQAELSQETEKKDPEKSENRPLAERLEEEGDIAADYLEGLLDIADLDGDIEIGVENERASLSIEGGELNHLVGREGEVLDALQELTRLAVQTSTGERSRLMLDIGGFRTDKKSALTKMAEEIAEEVKSGGKSIKLSPMNAFERKIIHDTIQRLGLTSESEGEDPDRCVVVMPN